MTGCSLHFTDGNDMMSALGMSRLIDQTVDLLIVSVTSDVST